MSVLLVILAVAGGLALMIIKALAVDQVRGQIQRRITADLEATIAILPHELRAEWADEWRAELAATISMPLTAARFVRNLRGSARELVADPALAGAGEHAQPPPTRRSVQWRFAGQRTRLATRFSSLLSPSLRRLSRKLSRGVAATTTAAAIVALIVTGALSAANDLVDSGVAAFRGAFEGTVAHGVTAVTGVNVTPADAGSVMRGLAIPMIIAVFVRAARRCRARQIASRRVGSAEPLG